MRTLIVNQYLRKPSIVTDGLVLHLDAGNTASYPGSGTTWYDLSGNQKDAAIVGGITFEQFPKRLTSDGATGYINLGTATQLNWSVVRTASFWITFNTISGFLFGAWDLVGGVDQRTMHIFLNPVGSIRQYWSPNGVNDGAIIAPPVNTNTWYLVTSVFRNGVRELWINDSLAASIAQATIYTGATTSRFGIFALLGRDVDTPAFFTNASVSSVFLYNRPLEQNEIAYNFNVSRNLFDI